MKVRSPLVIVFCLVVLIGCTKSADHSKGVYMLLDTSGTYSGELKKAQGIINYLLGTLQPGDALAVGRIDTGSGRSELDFGPRTQPPQPAIRWVYARSVGEGQDEVRGEGLQRRSL